MPVAVVYNHCLLTNPTRKPEEPGQAVTSSLAETNKDY